MTVYRFTASWCQPCKSLAKNLEMYGISLPTYDIDDPSVRPLLEKFEIRSVPTIVIEDNNGIVEKFIGPTLSNELRVKLKEMAR